MGPVAEAVSPAAVDSPAVRVVSRAGARSPAAATSPAGARSPAAARSRHGHRHRRDEPVPGWLRRRGTLVRSDEDPQGGFGGPGGGGGRGGFLNSSQSNAALNKLLQADASRYTWAAATVNSNNAAGYQLGSGEPVMAIGGFNGTDPTPTLAQFEKYVAEGKIHYFIIQRRRLRWRRLRWGRRTSNDASQITSWVEAHFTSETVGGVTVYNLTTGAS